MRKILISLILVVLSSNAKANVDLTIDSLVVYYREFCASYKFINSEDDKIKTFASPYKYTIKDRNKIKQVIKQLKIVKRNKSESYQENDGIVLGCYLYRNGHEELFFTILSFRQIKYQDEVYLYKDKFLDVLFDSHKECYY